MVASTPSHRHGVYRPDIDGLRAVAVLTVVANHFQPGTMTGGFVGVDVFFVISGFLITGIILEKRLTGRFTFADFYARRVRRIFPALSLVLVACLVAGWFVLDPAAYEDLGANTAAGAGFVSNLLLWKHTNYFAPEAISKPLLHLWSLGIEEQYYAFWPLLMAVLWKTRSRLVPVAAIAVASFALNAALSTSRPTAAFYSPAARIWELLVGSMIAYVGLTRGEPIALLSGLAVRDDPTGRRVLERRLRELSAWVGILLIGAAVFALTERSTFPGYGVLLPTAGTALLVCAGPEAWVNRTILAHPFMVLIGLISYPLYLWHWPVLTLIHTAFPDASRIARAFAMLCVFIVAWFTYKFIETPIRRSRSVRVVAGLSLSQVLLFLCGFALAGYRGIPGRFDAAHRGLFAIAQRPPPYSANYLHKRTCSLEVDQSAAEFLRACERVAAASTPANRVLLWGDSFAAHLVPGIEVAVSKGTDFYELTSPGCPPMDAFLEHLRPGCADTNALVSTLIRQLRPRTVFLAARWDSYPGLANIEATIRELKRIGIQQVVLIGSSVQYEQSVPRLLVKALDSGALPQRMQTPILPRLLATDSVLRAIAARSGAEFVSPLAAQCTPDGCLVSLNGSIESVTIYDTGHLTVVGSRLIAEQVLRPYLPR